MFSSKLVFERAHTCCNDLGSKEQLEVWSWLAPNVHS